MPQAAVELEQCLRCRALLDDADPGFKVILVQRGAAASEAAPLASSRFAHFCGRCVEDLGNWTARGTKRGQARPIVTPLPPIPSRPPYRRSRGRRSSKPGPGS